MIHNARPSQLDGLCEYAIAEQLIESALRHDLYSPAKKLFELGDQGHK